MMLGISEERSEQVISEFRDLVVDSVDPSWVPQQLLGCGWHGCVYSTQDPNTVCKTTTDLSEALFVDLMMKFQERPEGIVRYLKKMVLPVQDFGSDVFIIWREAAFDVGHVITKSSDETYQQVQFQYYLEIFMKAAVQIIKALQDQPDPVQMIEIVKKMSKHDIDFGQIFSHGFDDGWTRTKDLVRGSQPLRRLDIGLQMSRFSLDQMYRQSISRYVAEAIDFYMSKGILLADIHGGNIGRVHRQEHEQPIVVITDPGSNVLLSDGQVL